MVGRRVSAESTNDPVGGLACLSPAKDRAWVLLYNLVERFREEGYAAAVTVRLAGLPAGTWQCQGTAIAPGKCDPYLVWKALGSPESLTADQAAALLAASALPPAEPLPLAQGTVTLSLPGYSVLLLELAREPSK